MNTQLSNIDKCLLVAGGLVESIQFNCQVSHEVDRWKSVGIGQFTAVHKSQVQVLEASIQKRHFGFVSCGDAAGGQGADSQETLDTDVIS